MGYAQNTPQINQNAPVHSSNPHYENIYESIDQYAAALAAPAAPDAHEAAHPFRIQPQRSTGYRNELYDRTAGYDVPRQLRGSFASNTSNTRRANLHLDLNPNRPRYTSASRPHRQRSFDDTESYHYNNYIRYENIYEQIREDPIYRQSSSASGSRVYGRLDVIGHGIGRIERHLSSSCGNIDHYNLGGHYAVLGHSHLGTVGHIRLNAAASGSKCCDTKDATNGVKSSYSFFSCLGGENSQSMNNIYRASNGGTAPRENSASVGGSFPTQRPTGAIPKHTKSKNKASASNHNSTLNRISKSSLQWLLVNKWLPLWIGQGPDYKIIDFNFMFSRNCEGCGDAGSHQQGLVRFNGQAEMRPRAETEGQRPGRIVCNNQSVARVRECEYGSRRDNWWPESPKLGTYDVPRAHRQQSPFLRARSESPSIAQRPNMADPFRNWELNTENNSFRPANGRVRDVKRITDGTFRVKDYKESQVAAQQPERSSSPVPSTSRGVVNRNVNVSSDDEKTPSQAALPSGKSKTCDENPSSSSESMRTADRDAMEGSSDDSLGATASCQQISDVNSDNAEEDQIDDDDFPESDEVTPTESK